MKRVKNLDSYIKSGAYFREESNRFDEQLVDKHLTPWATSFIKGFQKSINRVSLGCLDCGSSASFEFSKDSYLVRDWCDCHKATIIEGLDLLDFKLRQYILLRFKELSRAGLLFCAEDEGFVHLNRKYGNKLPTEFI